MSGRACVSPRVQRKTGKEYGMNDLEKRLTNLLSVKSVVTLTLTGVFAFLSVAGRMSQEFMSIYTMVVGFYFGTQSARREGAR